MQCKKMFVIHHRVWLLMCLFTRIWLWSPCKIQYDGVLFATTSIDPHCYCHLRPERENITHGPFWIERGNVTYQSFLLQVLVKFESEKIDTKFRCISGQTDCDVTFNNKCTISLRLGKSPFSVYIIIIIQPARTEIVL